MIFWHAQLAIVAAKGGTGFLRQAVLFRPAISDLVKATGRVPDSFL